MNRLFAFPLLALLGSAASAQQVFTAADYHEPPQLVEAVDQAAPPVSPTAGQCWAIGIGTGLFAGHNNQVACWSGSVWNYTKPGGGWHLTNRTDSRDYTFVSAWTATGIGTPTAVSPTDIMGSSSIGRQILVAANSAAVQTLISLVPGVNVQAFNAAIACIAAASPNTNDVLQWKSGCWVPRSMVQLLVDLGGLDPSWATVYLGGPGVTDTPLTRSAAGRAAVGGKNVALEGVAQTNGAQPAFLAKLATNKTDVTGDGTAYIIPFDTPRFDKTTILNTSTGVATAAVTGTYQCSLAVDVTDVTTAFSRMTIEISTSNALYSLDLGDPQPDVNTRAGGSMTLPVDVDSGDIMQARVIVAGSTKTIDIVAASTFFGCTLLN